MTIPADEYLSAAVSVENRLRLPQGNEKKEEHSDRGRSSGKEGGREKPASTSSERNQCSINESNSKLATNVQTPLEMPKLNFSVIELELNKIVILL